MPISLRKRGKKEDFHHCSCCALQTASAAKPSCTKKCVKYDPKFCVDKDVKCLLKECVKAKFGDCLKYNDKCVEVSLSKSPLEYSFRLRVIAIHVEKRSGRVVSSMEGPPAETTFRKGDRR